MSAEIRPIGRRILFQIFDTPAEENVGGIIVPCAAKRSEHRRAVVRRTSNTYKGDLRPGMEVMLKPYCGTEITAGAEGRLVFAVEEEVIAVLDE